MFPFLASIADATEGAKPPVLLYNTLTRTKERFRPLRNDFVRMYNCGPTVYDYAHVGNLRSYVFADVLRRTLVANGYKVMQVVNITDVGHLTSDADDGDDKMTVGLKREGLPLTLEGMRQLSDKYVDAWLSDLEQLEIKRPNALPRASEHVRADVALIETLMQKEIAYRTPDGVYFDTAKFPGYGKLGGIDLSAQKAGARIEVHGFKRHPADFALWKRNDAIGWDSPWGRGFPGWHIECSAMAMEYLGKELDIHTGGIDHIGTHHNNEIAQSEAATGKPFAQVWMHNEHIRIEGAKISKSLRNTLSLRQLSEHGYAPLAYRYWLLTGHYRTPMNFSFAALDAAATALKRLHRYFVEELIAIDAKGKHAERTFALEVLQAVNDDLDTPKALACVWKLLKNESISPAVQRASLLYADRLLGLGLTTLAKSGAQAISLEVASQAALPQEIVDLVAERESARNSKDWARADELRMTLKLRGYVVSDTPHGQEVTRTA